MRGNTAAINRMVYGWFPYPDYPNTRCIALFGHNPRKHSWTPVYNAIRRAQQKGAKLIVLDPRRSENAELADIWLPLRPGTDAAMCFGWLKVILDEGLYDKAFVARWTVGFDAFRARVDEFPLDRVSAITGVDPDLIAAAARIYATNTPGVIPWTPITDQQRNSTSAIRLHCALRALTGALDVPGGEVLHGFHPEIVSETELELHEALPEAQRAKQLGSDTHPAFTYRGTAALREPTRRVWGRDHANLISGSYMANPSATFRAMADGVPYPVKAFFNLGNNTLMSFANMRADPSRDPQPGPGRGDGPYENADGAAWRLYPAGRCLDRTELPVRRVRLDGDPKAQPEGGRAPRRMPPGLRFLARTGAAHGVRRLFPWRTNEDVLDFRVAALGLSFEEFAERHPYHMAPPRFRKYEETGFATPSGKVELASSVLDGLGFDPLPYWRDAPPPPADYPLTLFFGLRDDPFFQTGHRHITALREKAPEPEAFVTAADAEAAGLQAGDWARVETPQGSVRLRVKIRDDLPAGLVRVPHGWWLPEKPASDDLCGAWAHADAQICPDDDDNLDREQGIPHLKGLPCRLKAA